MYIIPSSYMKLSENETPVEMCLYDRQKMIKEGTQE